MSLIILDNPAYRVKINTLGAELCGIESKELGKELMWQASEEIWDHSSLFMFPNTARIKDWTAVIRGKEYPQVMQGFCRDSEFDVIRQDASSVELALDSCEESRRHLPYEYRLRIVFELTDDALLQTVTVTNDDEGDMYFGMGFHPGFALPLGEGAASDHVLRFSKPQTVFRYGLCEGSKLSSGQDEAFLADSPFLRLEEGIFDRGAIVCGGFDTDTVTIVSEKSGMFVEMGVKGFSDIAFWGNPGVPRLCCIEPWITVSDRFDSDRIWENKPGQIRLSPGSSFSVRLSYRAGRSDKGTDNVL